MHKRFSIAALCGALFLAGALPAQANTPLSLGEQFALRSYTGQAMGLALTDVIKAKRVGIATNPSSICSSLSGAVGAQVAAKSSGKGPALQTVALNNAEDAARAHAALKDQEAIALLFGGQTPAEDNYAMVKAMLKQLAANDYQGAVLLHVRVWLPKMAQRAAAEDAQIAQYLAAKKNVYTVTVDAAKGRALVHQVSVDASEQRSAKVLHEVAMNEAWLELFKRSI